MRDPRELYEHISDLIAEHGAAFAICVVAILLALAFVLQQCQSGP